MLKRLYLLKQMGGWPNNRFHPTFLPPDLHLDFDIVRLRQNRG